MPMPNQKYLMLVRICLTFDVLLYVGIIRHTYSWETIEEKNTICVSKECDKRAKLLLKGMKSSVDPCQDFYEYVCGRWTKKNPTPPYAYKWSVEHQLQLEASTKIKQILEEEIQADDDKDKVLAKLVYRNCMDIPALGKLNADQIQLYMEHCKLAPSFNAGVKSNFANVHWTQVHNYYLSLTGESAFFEIEIETALEGSHEILTQIVEPTSPYGTITRLTDWSEEEKIKYCTFVQNIIQYALSKKGRGFKSPEPIVIERVIDFREDIDQIIGLEESYSGTGKKMTIKRFNSWYNKHTTNNLVAKINWLEVIRSFFKNSKYVAINDETVINIQGFKYFSNLVYLLEKTPVKTIVNHIHLYFIERQLRYNAKLKTMLSQSLTMTVPATGYFRNIQERWLYCTHDKRLTDIIGKIYTDKYFDTKTKHMAGHVFEQTKAIIASKIRESTWLSAKAKKVLLTKIESMKSFLGVPDWYKRPSLKALFKNIKMNPTEANAYFLFSKNYLLVNAAILASPVYDSDLPYAVNFGATMSIFAHEMYHAFDKTGINMDAAGSLIEWPKSIAKTYETQTSCFKYVYGKHNTEELKTIGVTTVKVSGDRTIDEDIADAMSIKASYQGLKDKLIKENGNCPILPYLDDITCEQLFFISFAATFCADMPTWSLYQHVMADKHSIPRVRVNGAVSNMDEFVRAFHCTDNAPMNTEPKCDLWQRPKLSSRTMLWGNQRSLD